MQKSIHRGGFTLIELLLVIALISGLASIVLLAAAPKKNFASAYDALRKSDAREMVQALYSDLIDNWEMPGGNIIQEGEESAKPICKSETSTAECASVSGVSLNDLPPEYIAVIPVDPAEPEGSQCTGYFVYTNVGRPRVYSMHMGKLPGDVINPSCGTLPPPPPPPPPFVCNGLPRTIYVDENNIIVGGPDDGNTYAGVLTGGNDGDVMIGTNGNDVINGGNGEDTICGLAGDDVINGDNSASTIFGGDGNDTLSGYNQSDTICGGNGNDTISGENSNDLLDGGDGIDTINGGNQSDVCVNGETVSSCEDTTTTVPECNS